MSYQIKVYHSSMYELLCSFLIYTTRKWTDDLDWGQEWIEDVSRRLDPAIVEQIATFRSSEMIDYDILYLWTILREPQTDIPSCIAFLETCPLDELYQRTTPYVDDVTIEDIARIRDSYTPLMKAWYEQYFAEIEHTIIPLLEEDANEKQQLISKMDPIDLVEYATNGVVVEPLDHLHTIILMPMIHSRPVNYYVKLNGMLLIQYAIDLPETNELQVPIGLARFTRALSDPKRLLILRYLAQELRTTSEIAEIMQMTPETVGSHIRILRVAGLLRTHLNDEKEKYSIRADGIAEMQLFLESYLRL